MLTAVFGWILNVLSSKAIGSITSALSNYFASRANTQIAKTQADSADKIATTQADRDVQIASIQAAAQEFAQESALQSVRWGWLPYRVLVLLVGFPPAWHAAGVYLDSCPILPWIDLANFQLVHHVVGSWDFVAAPDQYADFEFKILASIAGVIVGQSGIAAYLHKKKS